MAFRKQSPKQPNKPHSDAEKIYDAYVKGARPADLATEYGLEQNQVLDIINNVERSKGK